MNEYRDYKDIDTEEKEEDAQYFCRFTFGQFFTILVLEVVTLAFVFYLGAKYGTDYLKIDQADNRTPAREIAAGVQGTFQQQAYVPPETQDPELQALAKDAVKSTNMDLKERVRELLQKQEAEKGAAQPQQVQRSEQPFSTAQTVQQADAKPDQLSQFENMSQEEILDRINQLNAERMQPKKQAGTEQGETGLPKTTVNTGSKDGNKDEAKSAREGGIIRMKSPASGQYSIQVGSYPSMNEANAKVEDWRARGYPSFMMIADIPDRGRWYRVRIGGFATKEDAQAYLQKIKSNEGTDGIVVLNEQ